MERFDHSIRSFVIRTTRMSPHQRAAYARLRDRYVISRSFEEEYPHRGPRPLIVEIGFGMGDSLAAMAQAMPERDFLGVEVHRPGVGKLMGRMDRDGITNVRIYEGDAAQFLSTYLPDASVSAFHIFFPDPWPKKRHHKRRLIRPGFPEFLHSLLVAGGTVHMVTDWEDYALSMRATFDACPHFRNAHGGWAPRPDWRPETSFERKGIDAGRDIYELVYHRA